MSEVLDSVQAWDVHPLSRAYQISSASLPSLLTTQSIKGLVFLNRRPAQGAMGISPAHTTHDDTWAIAPQINGSIRFSYTLKAALSYSTPIELVIQFPFTYGGR